MDGIDINIVLEVILFGVMGVLGVLWRNQANGLKLSLIHI